LAFFYAESMARSRNEPAPVGGGPPRADDDESFDELRRRATSQHSLPLPPVAPDQALPERSKIERLFGSGDFFRLWMAQVVSALGDWLGFVAIIVIATRIGGASPAAAISLVMTARLVPGFFLAPVAGVLVDRWDRKKVMVTCDIVRAGVLLTLPFVETLFALVVASFVIEVATLLWSPAKEASVPNLVPAEQLTSANSLSLVAAYGTFPVATALFAALEKTAEWLAGFEALAVIRLDQASLALYVDAVTYLVAAIMISTLALPRAHKRPPTANGRRVDFSQTFRELREGWGFMFSTPVVRAVMLAISTGLIGAGMLVPLGDVFSRQVLGGGSAGYGLLLTALGTGVAGGVLALSVIQRRLPKINTFCLAVIVSSFALGLGASMSSLAPALVFVSILGVCGGAVYVLGFTILHESVVDEMRGRIFAALYTLVRFCLLLAFAVGPLLADRLGALSTSLFDGEIELAGIAVALPGVRLAMWFAAAIILAAGVLAVASLRFSSRSERAVIDLTDE
jgi:MFS family permease